MYVCMHGVQGKQGTCAGKLNFLCKLICTGEDDLEEVIDELYGISDVTRLGVNLGIHVYSGDDCGRLPLLQKGIDKSDLQLAEKNRYCTS